MVDTPPGRNSVQWLPNLPDQVIRVTDEGYSGRLRPVWRGARIAAPGCVLCYNALMAEPPTDTSMLPEPQSLLGTWRRFGPVGPVHEIIGIGKELPDQIA